MIFFPIKQKISVVKLCFSNQFLWFGTAKSFTFSKFSFYFSGFPLIFPSPSPNPLINSPPPGLNVHYSKEMPFNEWCHSVKFTVCQLIVLSFSKLCSFQPPPTDLYEKSKKSLSWLHTWYSRNIEYTSTPCAPPLHLISEFPPPRLRFDFCDANLERLRK